MLLRKTISGLMLTFLLIGMLTWTLNIQLVKSEEEFWSEEVKLYENAGLGDLEVFHNNCSLSALMIKVNYFI